MNVQAAKNIDEVEFTIFDTETTGLEPDSGDRIVEIAGARVKGDRRISIYQSLINPGRPISQAAFQVNGITQEMLKGAPGVEKVIPEFLDFIKGSCLCSYNAGFDLGFLNNELKIIGRRMLTDIVVVDVLKMARRLLPGLERYALWFVAEKLGILQKQEHRAFSDVELTIAVFDKLKYILTAKGIVDFTNFSHLFAIQPSLLKDLDDRKIAQVQEAIGLGAKLKIKYLSTSGLEVTEREVIPKEIRHENGRGYLVGYCCLREDERTFRIDGILRLELL
jgi:DNA polymerase-3 subunit alpha (Gram-positive type)